MISMYALFVISVWMYNLFNSVPVFRELTCLIAVRNDCGLNSLLRNVILGMVVGSSFHWFNCISRWERLSIHDPRGLVDGKANFAHVSGTLFK